MWLALRFPHWALDSRADGLCDRGATILVVETRAGRRWIIAASRDALQQGVRRGMALADARLHVSEADVIERHAAGEQASLERLAGWAWRYSSQVHIACADETVECTRLLIEIGASLRLFGGRRALLSAVRQDLARLGYRCRMGVGDTPQAALAFARAPRRCRALEQLPLSCLALEARTAESLYASGLRHAGELLALPPAALVRRFGHVTLDYLERLRGRRPHALVLHRLPERYRTRHELVGSVETTQGLLFVLRRALTELAAFLRGADAAIQSLRLTLIHDDVPVTRLTLRLSAPTHEAAHLEQVASDRLTRLTLAAPVLELALESDRLRPFEHSQNRLWRDTADFGADHWPAVLDRLRSRLGHDAVGWLHAVSDHRPEYASVCRDHPPGDIDVTPAPRPLWLLDTPQLVTGALELLAGPERIETGWWHTTDLRRDYFRALDVHGRLLWVYRDLAAGRQNDPPVYYLHGLFG